MRWAALLCVAACGRVAFDPLSDAPAVDATTAVTSQRAYIKASNTDPSDYFGGEIALSGDGSTLAVGSRYEASAGTGIDGNQADNSALQAGAVYVFTRSGT